MVFEFEKRPYGPDSTAEEIVAMRARVSIRPNGIVEVVDIPVGSRFSLEIYLDEIKRLTSDWPTVNLLVDLSRCRPPSAEYREALYSVDKLEPRLAKVALYTGPSRVLQTVTKFALVVFRRHMQADVFRDHEAALRYLEDDDER